MKPALQLAANDAMQNLKIYINGVYFFKSTPPPPTCHMQIREKAPPRSQSHTEEITVTAAGLSVVVTVTVTVTVACPFPFAFTAAANFSFTGTAVGVSVVSAPPSALDGSRAEEDCTSGVGIAV